MTENISLIQSLLFSGEAEKTVAVNGNSMWPFLQHGQIVTVGRIQNPLKQGRCYLFIHNNSIFIHRLLKTLSGKAVFAGDYSGDTEEIPLESVIGELKISQNKIILFVLNLINNIFIYGLPVLARRTRLRNTLLSAALRLEKKMYERKI